MASYKVTVLHREDGEEHTGSIHTCLESIAFPQSNGSQHRTTPPKLTLSNVRISVSGNLSLNNTGGRGARDPATDLLGATPRAMKYRAPNGN